jgi:hypothetical protein
MRVRAPIFRTPVGQPARPTRNERFHETYRVRANFQQFRRHSRESGNPVTTELSVFTGSPGVKFTLGPAEGGTRVPGDDEQVGMIRIKETMY